MVTMVKLGTKLSGKPLRKQSQKWSRQRLLEVLLCRISWKLVLMVTPDVDREVKDVAEYLTAIEDEKEMSCDDDECDESGENDNW